MADKLPIVSAKRWAVTDKKKAMVTIGKEFNA
jgi:D-alanyl-D-alanine carboxypeptidase (penicillin-binding protein 5/6)